MSLVPIWGNLSIPRQATRWSATLKEGGPCRDWGQGTHIWLESLSLYFLPASCGEALPRSAATCNPDPLQLAWGAEGARGGGESFCINMGKQLRRAEFYFGNTVYLSLRRII